MCFDIDYLRYEMMKISGRKCFFVIFRVGIMNIVQRSGFYKISPYFAKIMLKDFNKH